MRSVDAPRGLVDCGLLGSNGTPHRTRAGSGCERWEREPGIDDDDWDPPGTPRIAPWTPEAPPAPRARRAGHDGWWTEPARPRRPAPTAMPTQIHLLTTDPFGGLFNWDDD